MKDFNEKSSVWLSLETIASRTEIYVGLVLIGLTVFGLVTI